MDQPSGDPDSSGGDTGTIHHDPDSPEVADSPACDRNAVKNVPARLRLLTSNQYVDTIVSTLLGRRSTDRNRDLRSGGKPIVKLPSDFTPPLAYVNTNDRFTTLSDSYRVSDNEFEDVIAAAEVIATEMVARLASEHPCLLASDDFTACLAPMVRFRGSFLFRRPLQDAEVDAFVDLGARALASAGRTRAAKLVFQALLSSPDFLYQTEVGQPDADDPQRQVLTGFEVASALSFSLLDGPPDETLWSLAEAGALTDRDVIAGEVERLVTPLQDAPAVRRFLTEYLGYDQAGRVTKEPITGIDYDAAALVRDTEGFVRDTVATAGRKDFLSTLLLSTSIVSGTDTESWYAPDSEQVGILGQPAWLIALSQPDHNDPIRRGRFVQESLLCGEVPAIPIDTVPELPQDPDRSLRDRLDEILASPNCQACHALMNPIGYGFEGFDHYGRVRHEEAGRPVDDSGVLTGSGDQDGPFRGVKELATRLVASATPPRCFSAHAFEYMLGRKPLDDDACAVDDARRAFANNGGDLLALLQEIFASPLFLTRTP